jgi:hypothetical protein
LTGRQAVAPARQIGRGGLERLVFVLLAAIVPALSAFGTFGTGFASLARVNHAMKVRSRLPCFAKHVRRRAKCRNQSVAAITTLAQTEANMSTDSPDVVEAPLKAFEEALVTPFVPGEIDGWLSTTCRAYDALELVLRKRLSHDHPQQLKTIQREDDELSARVDEMRKCDQALLERLDRLAWYIEGLKVRENNGDGETQKLDVSAERMAEEGLKLVIDVRKQEAAINTWFVEAFHRDRGVGD